MNLVCQITAHISYQIIDLIFFDKSKQKLLTMAFLTEKQNYWTDWLVFCYCVGSSYWKTRTTILRRRFSPLSMYKMLHTRKLLQTACRLYGEYTLPQFRIRFQGFRFRKFRVFGPDSLFRGATVNLSQARPNCILSQIFFDRLFLIRAYWSSKSR